MTLPIYLPGQDMKEYLDRLVGDIERRLATSSAGGPYQVTNPVAMRALTATTATPDQTAQFVATLAQDLRRKGILS